MALTNEKIPTTLRVPMKVVCKERSKWEVKLMCEQYMLERKQCTLRGEINEVQMAIINGFIGADGNTYKVPPECVYQYYTWIEELGIQLNQTNLHLQIVSEQLGVAHALIDFIDGM